MMIHFKMTGRLYEAIRRDLHRPHSYAAERVGFIACRSGLSAEGLVIVAHDYMPVADDDYIDTVAAGAMMSSKAIRVALQHALDHRVSMFHVHEHGWAGLPKPSLTDSQEWSNFVPNFWNVQPNIPHGAVILSSNAAMGRCWIPGQEKPAPIIRFTIAGFPLKTWRAS